MSVFRTSKQETSNFKTPQEMYDDYKTRTIEGIHDYQSKMIDSYMGEDVINRKDVELELPTGERVIIVMGAVFIVVSRLSGTFIEKSCTV